MTYAELIAKLQTWWESDETAFLAEVDTFIEHAEKRIYRSVDLNVTHVKDILPISESNRGLSITTPGTFRIFQTINFVDSSGVYTPLLQKDRSFLEDYAPDPSVESLPRYYAIYNENLIIVPTPNAAAAAGTLHVTYVYYPSQISSGNTPTWLSTHAPDVLFYACMLEVLTFQKAEPDTIQDYTAKYQQALQGLVLEENLRNRTDEYREGEIKMGAPQ